MKVLLYGMGWIGSMVYQELEKRGVEVVKGKSRCDETVELENEILAIKPTHVMCFVGRTYGVDKQGQQINSIDYLEEKGRLYENVRDNLFSPMVLGFLCTKYDIHLTYMGTGCIFEYEKDNFGKEVDGFTEDSKPNFFGSSYSVVKGFTDRLVKMLDKNVLNLRIRMPITSERNNKNFINKLLKYDRICSIPNSMTVLPELIPIMIDMASKKTVGTFNMCNPGLISHDEILAMYKEIVDPGFTWNNFTREEQSKLLLSERSNNYLDTTKLTQLYPGVKHIKDSVRDVLKSMRQS